MSGLASAKAAGKKVWLLMHVPPGAYTVRRGPSRQERSSDGATMMLKPEYQASFLQILSKYPGIITLTLAGHTHMDEFRKISGGVSSSLLMLLK